MWKFVVGSLVGFAAAVAAMYASNPAYFDGRIPTMEDGSYTAYHIQKMFDTRTGEPVYWVVGGKGRKVWFTDIKVDGYIEPNETKLYIIPRNKLAGLAEDTVSGALQIKDYRIDVANGVGRIIQR